MASLVTFCTQAIKTNPCDIAMVTENWVEHQQSNATNKQKQKLLQHGKLLKIE